MGAKEAAQMADLFFHCYLTICAKLYDNLIIRGDQTPWGRMIFLIQKGVNTGLERMGLLLPDSCWIVLFVIPYPKTTAATTH